MIRDHHSLFADAIYGLLHPFQNYILPYQARSLISQDQWHSAGHDLDSLHKAIKIRFT